VSEDKCFCGAEWNDVAEECVDGHAFGEEEKLRAALKLAVRWMGDPRDPLGTFEDIGEWFYRDTGFLRPGKSEPLECGGRDEERAEAWKDWAHRTREHVYETCRKALAAPSERPEHP
jgi:hypothetical protein